MIYQKIAVKNRQQIRMLWRFNRWRRVSRRLGRLTSNYTRPKHPMAQFSPFQKAVIYRKWPRILGTMDWNSKSRSWTRRPSLSRMCCCHLMRMRIMPQNPIFALSEGVRAPHPCSSRRRKTWYRTRGLKRLILRYHSSRTEANLVDEVKRITGEWWVKVAN